MRRVSTLICVFAAMVVAPLTGQAATIGFSPSASSVEVGDSLFVDVVVSDLGGEIVSAYDLDVTYDDSVLSADSITLSSALGDEFLFEGFYDSDLSISGVVDFAGLSLLSDADLLAGQGGDSVVLATIEFSAIANGHSDLDFTFDAFNDINGANAAVLVVDSNPGSVDVGAVIPEPTAAVVFLAGLLLTRRAVRRRPA